MAFLVFTNEIEAEEARTRRDKELGYPESLESLHYIGGGIHAPKELGRALHYCEITKSDAEEKWAILDIDQVAPEPGAIKVDELPINWYPTLKET